MERFMILITPKSNDHELVNSYQINGMDCSFKNGKFTFITSGEDTVSILGLPAYIMITPFNLMTDYKHNVMVTLDDSKTPTVIFDGKNDKSCFEVSMNNKCEIVFKEDNATDCLTPSDIDEIIDKPDVKAEEPKRDNKPSIQKPVKADGESSDNSLAELTSYDKILNAVYEIFEENSIIPYDRELFNDLCGDGIRTEASNWKCSMFPYIVTIQKDPLPKYSNVLHVIIEKTNKFTGGYSSGMYANRGVLKMLLIFNDEGYLTRLATSSKVIDPADYLNQEIRDLFKAIDDAKEECNKSEYRFVEDLMDVALPAECGIHC